MPDPVPATPDEDVAEDGSDAPEDAESSPIDPDSPVQQDLQTLEDAGQRAAEEPGAEDSGGDDPFAGSDSDDLDVDLADIDVGEEAENEDSGGDPFSGSDSGGMGGETAAPDPMGDAMGGMADTADAPLDQIINEGAARTAVVGITDPDQKEELEEEFTEVAEAFRLGHFGEQVLDEYVLTDDEVDPIWGLTGSLLLFGAIVLHRRPDGGEVVSNASETLSRFTENLR